MGSALPSENLDRNNFASWEYKMHQYLVGQGYWSYIKGAQENRPDPKNAYYATYVITTSMNITSFYVMGKHSTCIEVMFIKYVLIKPSSNPIDVNILYIIPRRHVSYLSNKSQWVSYFLGVQPSFHLVVHFLEQGSLFVLLLVCVFVYAFCLFYF